jgi:hypothetical protein
VPSQSRNNVLTIVLLRLRFISVDDDGGVVDFICVRSPFAGLVGLSRPADGF